LTFRLRTGKLWLTGRQWGALLGLIQMRFPPIPVKKVIKYSLFAGLITLNFWIYK